MTGLDCGGPASGWFAVCPAAPTGVWSSRETREISGRRYLATAAATSTPPRLTRTPTLSPNRRVPKPVEAEGAASCGGGGNGRSGWGAATSPGDVASPPFATLSPSGGSLPDCDRWFLRSSQGQAHPAEFRPESIRGLASAIEKRVDPQRDASAVPNHIRDRAIAQSARARGILALKAIRNVAFGFLGEKGSTAARTVIRSRNSRNSAGSSRPQKLGRPTNSICKSGESGSEIRVSSWRKESAWGRSVSASSTTSTTCSSLPSVLGARSGRVSRRFRRDLRARYSRSG